MSPIKGLDHRKIGSIVSLFTTHEQCQDYGKACGQAILLDDGSRGQGCVHKLHHTYWNYTLPTELPTPPDILYWIQTINSSGWIEVIQSSVQPVLPAPVPSWYRVVPATNIGYGTGPACPGQYASLNGITEDFYNMDATSLSTLYVIQSYTPANTTLLPPTPNRWTLAPLSLNRFHPGDLLQVYRNFGPTVSGVFMDEGTPRIMNIVNVLCDTQSWYLTPTCKKYNVLYTPVRIAPKQWTVCRDAHKACPYDSTNYTSQLAIHEHIELIVTPMKQEEHHVAEHDPRLHEYLTRHGEHAAKQWYNFNSQKASLWASKPIKNNTLETYEDIEENGDDDDEDDIQNDDDEQDQYDEYEQYDQTYDYEGSF